MKHRRQILIATDGSEMAERAVAFGAVLAQPEQTDLHLCYAINYVAKPAILVSSQAHDAPDILRAEGQRAIDSAKALLRPLGAPIESHVLEGDPSSAILACAQAIGADVIVLGTHGRTGFPRATLGSTAEGIIRRTTIPVIILSPNVRGVQRGGLTRIVVAIDGSAASRQAAETAYMFASHYGAEVDLCYVIDSTSVTPSMHPDALALGTALLEAEAVHALHFGIPAVKHIVEGPIAPRLLDFATTHGAALIAIGTHGRTGVDRMLYGSVAEALFRQSTLPVLVTRSKAHELPSQRAVTFGA